MGFLHLYLKYTQPLFVQAIMAFKSPLRGQNGQDSRSLARKLTVVTSNDLSRAGSGAVWWCVLSLSLSHALPLDIPYLRNVIYTASADPQTDKAAIEEAEKRLWALRKSDRVFLTGRRGDHRARYIYCCGYIRTAHTCTLVCAFLTALGYSNTVSDDSLYHIWTCDFPSEER